MTIVAATKDTDWYLSVSKIEVKAVSSAVEVDLLNSAIKQSIPRDWLPIIFKECEESPSVISVNNKGGFDFSNQDVNGWISLIREGLYSIPTVEDIFVSIEGSDVDVWVVIPERNLAILHQIVEMEWELIKPFVSGENPPFLIDFHVIYRCGRNVPIHKTFR